MYRNFRILFNLFDFCYNFAFKKRLYNFSAAFQTVNNKQKCQICNKHANFPFIFVQRSIFTFLHSLHSTKNSIMNNSAQFSHKKIGKGSENCEFSRRRRLDSRWFCFMSAWNLHVCDLFRTVSRKIPTSFTRQHYTNFVAYVSRRFGFIIYYLNILCRGRLSSCEMQIALVSTLTTNSCKSPAIILFRIGISNRYAIFHIARMCVQFARFNFAERFPNSKNRISHSHRKIPIYYSLIYQTRTNHSSHRFSTSPKRLQKFN